MNARASLANTAWCLTCLPAWWKFRRALARPDVYQAAILKQLIRHARFTAFGREHAFDQIRDYADFTKQVPIRDYDKFVPWIERIRRGDKNVLTPDDVIRLATTSGTTQARKLIPYTSSLQQDFSRAVSAWIVDLFYSDSSMMTGPAYWSISPVVRDERTDDSAVPIGFEEDSEYLGGVRKRLVDWTMAVPAQVRHAKSLDEFREQTMAHLRRRRDLRLISVWHPSFLKILLANTSTSPRALWPNLRLISCWADGQSSSAADELQSLFPAIKVQPKGLIATEAVVSIPFQNRFPLAITSHFLEFVDSSGQVHLAHELMAGAEYEVLVTTGGGLWRYRLNDIVRVEGHIQNTPSIRFIGKSGNVSDRFGEKLSEAFVSKMLDELRADNQLTGVFAMLAPEGNSYILYIEGIASPEVPARLDHLLRENPHYAYCRDLGQLGQPRVFRVHKGADLAVIMRLSSLGQRLGDIKPAPLSRLDGWTAHFNGKFESTT